ncbi:type II secretion system F family protein [Patescibacteria group bacterium]
MANFFYKANNQDKKISEGQISAKTKEEVVQILEKKDLSVLVVKPVVEKITFKGSIPQVEKITFCRYLYIMLSTGMSLSEGIEVLREETKNPLMYKVLGDMSYSLEQGQQLSTIFERYPNIFENYFLTLTRAGEVSGKLAEVFKYLENELRAEYSLNAKVKGALLYPAIVFVAMIAIGTLMFFFVLPQIGRVFLSLKLPLPSVTKFLFTTSIALSQYVVPIIIGGVVLLILGALSLRNRAVRDMLFMLIKPIPLIHNLLQKIDLARFNRIFSTLIKSAVPITDALEISFSSLSMVQYRNLAKTFPEDIKRGKTLSSLIKESKLFPSLMVQMVAAGEKTATIDATLEDLASFYEGEVEEEVKSLTQVIEPVLMLFVGIAVGAMILSIIGPIYSVVGNFQQAAGGQGGL